VKVADGQARESESHAIVDFSVGKDVGLGFLGSSEGSSTISGGLRFVQFTSKSNALLRGEPDVNYGDGGPFTSVFELVHFVHPSPPIVFHDFAANASAKRRFHGVGPSIKWDASLPVSGDHAASGFDLDWGFNGALLFGRQKARGHHQTTNKLYSLTNFMFGSEPGKGYDRIGYFINNSNPNGGPLGLGPVSVQNNPAKTFNRRRTVVVPNIGAFAGISYRYNNAKVSFGYRADYFFGAIDGGWDSRQTENRGFFGPYANISIGFGNSR
jgi:hypothetical protein